MKYVKPIITVIDIAELTVMLRCACSREDDNVW